MQASVSELNGWNNLLCYLPLIDNDIVISKSQSVLATFCCAAFQFYAFSHYPSFLPQSYRVLVKFFELLFKQGERKIKEMAYSSQLAS